MRVSAGKPRQAQRERLARGHFTHTGWDTSCCGARRPPWPPQTSACTGRGGCCGSGSGWERRAVQSQHQSIVTTATATVAASGRRRQPATTPQPPARRTHHLHQAVVLHGRPALEGVQPKVLCHVADVKGPAAQLVLIAAGEVAGAVPQLPAARLVVVARADVHILQHGWGVAAGKIELSVTRRSSDFEHWLSGANPTAAHMPPLEASSSRTLSTSSSKSSRSMRW